MGRAKQFEIEHNEQQKERYEELLEKDIPGEIQKKEEQISDIKANIQSLADDIIDLDLDDLKDHFSSIEDEKENLAEVQSHLKKLEEDLDEMNAIKEDLGF